ncbi:hypothetical protein KUL42_28660 [Alteromonas sp. KUL42]|uniref:hypothetical protein n=1 Tax=Alteromonas sp. KUL42 TaxID=2480797 RepID=UPI0010361023|nr:hypothetical protein [Alteromonas sp. KUL42]TAP34040.1 hypothetical protein EYR97_13415 [Alteromonas sp. KUL42]GEA08105.1 hypothetical protein KUL42_28660 [Alteromonas sp. KUL42]
MNTAQQTSIVPHILFGMFILELIFLMVKKVNLTFYGPFDLFEKLFPIIAIGLLVTTIRPRLNYQWWAALGFYIGYLLYGIAISLANQKGMKIILVQLYHELKFFPMVMLFAVARCDEIWTSRTIKVIKPLIFLCILLIIFQAGAPGAYDALFKSGGHFEPGHLGGRLVPRFVGWFWHPGQSALFFTIAAVLISVEYHRGHIRFGHSLVFLCIVFVFCAIQRLELMLLFMALLALKVQRIFNFDYRFILSLIVFAFFTWLIGYLSWDKNNVWHVLENFESPRVIFLVESVFVLFESDFLGGGWGTIGSHAAADVAKVYEYNAMKDLWWIKLGQYFYDTYWPHVIGETGLPGYFLLLLSMTFMVCALKRPEASLLLFLLLLTSALSSNAQSLYHLTIFGWFITLLESDANGWRRDAPEPEPVLNS